MITTTIQELKDLFYDYVYSVVPGRHIKYIMRGDYPKPNKPSVFISYVLTPNGNADHDYDMESDSETVISNQTMTFTVDVVGGDFESDTQALMQLLWHSNTWETIYAKGGFGGTTGPADLTVTEQGNIRGRYQFTCSFHCKFANTLSVATFDSLQAKICEVDHVGDDDCIDIDTRNLPRCP